mmetsp:Transcript_13205/g.15154  ORF Transcript_13205/g.15154 Transcript_13205/m.15154 type:complete len:312 (-) Transcript_13205:73-1008(-)
MTVNVSYSTKAKSLLSGSIDFLDISEDQCLDDKEEKFANNHFNPPLHKLHRQRPLDCREKFDVVVSGSKKYNFLFSSSRDESVLQESMEKEDYCIYDSSLKSILRVINSKRQNQIRKNTSKKLARISACPDHNVSSNNVAIDVIDGSLRKTKFSSSETYVVPHSSKFNKGQNLHLTAPLSTSADITGMFDERQYSHDDTSDYKRNTCQTEGQRKMKSSHSLTTLITSQVPVSRNNSSRSRKNKGYTSSDLFQRHKPQDICRMIQRKSKLRSVKSLDIQDSKFQTTMVIPDYSNYVLRSVQKFKRNLLKLYF